MIIRNVDKKSNFCKMKLFLKMKSFKTCLDIIPEKITTSTKMQGTLKTPQTHASAEHAAQKIDQFV